MTISNEAIGRRAFLKTGSVAATMAAGFTISTKTAFASAIFRALSKENPSASERTLRAFVEAVVPGSDPNHRDAIRVFSDSDLPFYKHRAMFVRKLDHRAQRLFGGRAGFAALSLTDRQSVIEHGLKKGLISRELFHAGIFVTQVSHYSGIYDSARGAPFIGFSGALSGPIASSVWHHDHLDGLPTRSLTTTGNHD